jgi:hypothetical protein
MGGLPNFILWQGTAQLEYKELTNFWTRKRKIE